MLPPCTENGKPSCGPDVQQTRLRQAVPFDRRVRLRVARLRELAVLEEEERLDDELRNVLERVELTIFGRRIEERQAALVADDERGRARLGVRRRDPPLDETRELARHAGLLLDPIAGFAEPLRELGDPRVPAPLVEGPALRKRDVAARTGFHAIGEARDVARDEPCLQRRGAELVAREAQNEEEKDDPANRHPASEATQGRPLPGRIELRVKRTNERMSPGFEHPTPSR